MKEVTICKSCRYYYINPDGYNVCENENAPITDFICGLKKCVDINKGDCEFYEPK